MSPISSRHAACVNNLTRLLSPLNLRQKIVLAIQNPVLLEPDSEPQPDVSILKPRQDMYQFRHPSAEDVYWLIEVAETSQHIDRNVKIQLYARSGIREVWLIDLTQEVVERYIDPSGDRFMHVEKFVTGDEISPHAFPDFHLAIKDILLK
ncbi:MAG: Uma2 family endonuclease [candidate division KSB1 bacterium]|nr:Uma2 family endonuclease [candidate division KSB1 bacterium]